MKLQARDVLVIDFLQDSFEPEDPEVHVPSVQIALVRLHN